MQIEELFAETRRHSGETDAIDDLRSSTPRRLRLRASYVVKSSSNGLSPSGSLDKQKRDFADNYQRADTSFRHPSAISVRPISLLGEVSRPQKTFHADGLCPYRYGLRSDNRPPHTAADLHVRRVFQNRASVKIVCAANDFEVQ